ncbi:MAG: N-6 DNA methylase [Chitinivibrionia bacterium]|nr:N-6 DNA methylase [Chitinivibrionia bacterium]
MTKETDEINEYIFQLNDKYKEDVTTEHSFRGALETLLKNLTDCTVINEARHIECGAPDLTLLRKNIPVSYVEAKDIGKKLDDKNYKEQFDRYKKALDHLIITDYLVFEFYEYGEFVENIRIAELKSNDGVIAVSQQFTKFESLLNKFCNSRPQKINSPAKLAEIMANKARLMSQVIENVLKKSDVDGSLSQQLSAIKEILIPDISPKQFADIYAQTITYGMFAACSHSGDPDTFSIEKVTNLIPKSNPFLRNLFKNISGGDLDDHLAWIVDDLAQMFRASDMRAIMKNFGENSKQIKTEINFFGESVRAAQQTDPVLHFYEDFLFTYDPALRKSRGVFYTPKSVVNFIVKAIDEILQNEFSLQQGLADTSKVKIKICDKTLDKQSQNVQTETEVHKVQILDPATGTGTFLAEAANKIYEKFSGQSGLWQGYVEQHLIPRLNGFELLMSSYTIAHIKLEYLLAKTGFLPKNDERFNIYLTNSLEEQHADVKTPFAQFLANEANEANKIKRDIPVMVVLGNPPYSGESQNNGKWIMNLINEYKKEHSGIKLQEKNPKWINDDYVKFIRLGQHFIEKNGEGILAFINNNGFLDNPTFRGMRYSLLNTFDKIYVLDLHGNSKKKETSPDGSKDENIFDIMQGVSINIFVKKTYHPCPSKGGE